VVFGIGLIAAVAGGVFVRRVYFSKKSMLQIDTDQKTFTGKFGTYYQEDQPLSMIDSIELHSKFVDKYMTAARNEVEEHQISIKIHLITKE